MNAKRIFFLLSLLPLALLLSKSWLGAEVQFIWFSPLNIEFHHKIDALSLIFLYLTALVIPFCIIVAKHSFSLILALQWLLIAFFTARDLAFFVFFWEAMLIPLYLLIVQKDVALKFLLYMIAGSLLMIAGTLAIYLAAGSFNLDVLSQIKPFPLWIALTFFLAFAVKTPLFPFHGWLPDTYTFVPTASTILLAALLSKAGIYGFLRLGPELFPEGLKMAAPYMLTLAIAGVLYGALAAWRQSDYKRLLAYSSFSHVNFILAGAFAANLYAEEGAILQAFNHGITITALFLVAGWLENRIGTTFLGNYGLAAIMPKLCWFTLFFVLSSVALPGLNNFVGEVLILFGLFRENPWLAAILALTVIFSVVYMLRFMQNIFFGRLDPQKGPDIGIKEVCILLPLVVLILGVGLYPAPLMKNTATKVERR